MNPEKKMCPSCKCNKLVTDFYGLRKAVTYKCISCNTRAAKYIRKQNAPKREEEKKQILKEFIEKYNLNISDYVI